MGSRWNFRYGVEERRIGRQISGGWGWIFLRMERGKERGKRLNFWGCNRNTE
jgi:hypothetical protein